MNSLDFEGEKKPLNRENFRGLMKAQIMPEIQEAQIMPEIQEAQIMPEIQEAQIMPEIQEAQIMPEIQEAQIMPVFEIWKKKNPLNLLKSRGLSVNAFLRC